jgi:uncharacterized membrane protein YedE/YeeE
MESAIHIEVLGAVFVVALVMGAVAAKTNFCTMGAVSDWVNMGETSRMRAWLLAMAVAIAVLLILETSGVVTLPPDAFPPYRTPNFAWPRYILGGLMFGAGMVLASGCGYRTMVRIGGGNLKSVVVLAVAGVAAYLMVWTDFYIQAFGWLAPATIDLAHFGLHDQTLPSLIGAPFGLSGGTALHVVIGALAAAALALFAFASHDFRRSRDNVMSGLVVGLGIAAGWFITGGPAGAEWKDWAALAEMPPSRVSVQSYTFISPMADLVHYLKTPGNLWLINFGITALVGVILGSFLYAIMSRRFRIEWFASVQDVANHIIGAVLMGIGGVLAMGCTIGQGVTGVSTLALGSMLAAVSFMAGAAAVMRYQYWMIMREA